MKITPLNANTIIVEQLTPEEIAEYGFPEVISSSTGAGNRIIVRIPSGELVIMFEKYLYDMCIYGKTITYTNKDMLFARIEP